MLIQGTPEMYDDWIAKHRKNWFKSDKKATCACSRNGVKDLQFTKHSKYNCSNNKIGLAKA
jgi:hypothetical protein